MGKHWVLRAFGLVLALVCLIAATSDWARSATPAEIQPQGQARAAQVVTATPSYQRIRTPSLIIAGGAQSATPAEIQPQHTARTTQAAVPTCSYKCARTPGLIIVGNAKAARRPAISGSERPASSSPAGLRPLCRPESSHSVRPGQCRLLSRPAGISGSERPASSSPAGLRPLCRPESSHSVRPGQCRLLSRPATIGEDGAGRDHSRVVPSCEPGGLGSGLSVLGAHSN
jgi:hypothetical protein